MRIKPLFRHQPHPCYGGWWNFLTEHCEVRDTYEGVTFYGNSNCNYIVWPNGRMVQNYGYHGKALMNRIRQEGDEAVLAAIEERFRELRSLLKAIEKHLRELRSLLKKRPVTGK